MKKDKIKQCVISSIDDLNAIQLFEFLHEPIYFGGGDNSTLDGKRIIIGGKYWPEFSLPKPSNIK